MRNTSSLERKRLKELIEEYSELGYDVFAEYKGYQRPEAIGNFVPDLVAKKEDRTIIVEITTKRNLSRLSEKMEQLSKYADENKNIRFDIVLTNPRPRLSRKEKEISNEILLTEIQERLFQDSKELYRKGYYEASYLMLSILLENLLRKLAIKKKVIDIDKKIPTTQLTSLLLSNKRISKSNYATIKKLFEYRNRVIHEYYRPDKQTLEEFINFSSYFIKKIK